MSDLSTFKELFESARYDEIVQMYSQENRPELANSYVVGGFTFKGDSIDASVIARSNKWKGNEEVRVYFFLFLGSIRSGEYAESKSAVIKLFQIYKSNKALYSKFYLNQAMGIYFFYKGLISKSSYFSESAFRLALELKNEYECLISADLLGHSLCLDKKFGEGIVFFERAKKYAKKINNNLNLSAINLSLLTYRVESGDNLSGAYLDLLSWLSSNESQDSFSKLNVYLLLSEFYLISGKISLAEETLNTISESIYSAKHIKQILKLNYLYALLFFYKSQFTSCLQIISNTKNRSLNERNQVYLSDFRSLENRVKEKLNMTASSLVKRDNKLNEPAHMTRRDFVSQNNEMISNQGLSLQTVQKLQKQEMLGLLFYQSIYNCENFIDTRLGAKCLIICFQSHIKIINTLSSNQIGLLKMLIQKKKWAKKDFYEDFWGGTYDPFIHDNKIFITIKRLNNKLNFEKNALNFSEGELYVSQFKLLSDTPKKSTVSTTAPSKNLNFRQRLFLQSSKPGEIVLPREYSQTYNISRNTTTRDLKDLVEQGLITQYGTNKGTYYLVI